MAEVLTIDHVGHRGDGVAIGPHGMIFVPATLPGEIVEAKPNVRQPDRAALVRIDTPSTERVVPFCPVFTRCGGCAIQHWEAEPYRAWKRGLVADALGHARIDAEVGELVDAHGAGRRRVTIHARRGQSASLQVGFAAAGSHEIVPVEDCPILDPALSGAFDAARAIADVLAGTGKPLDIQVTATDNGLDIDVRGSGPLDARITGSLAQLAQRLRLTRLTRHGELVVLIAPPTLLVGKAAVTLPPASFLQATKAGEEALAAQVIALCERAKSVADLFCGVGPFALRLAERSRVSAFDSDEGAVAALQKAAPATSGLKPVRAERRDLFRRPLVPQELNEADVVVLDPPRQGAEAQARQLAQSRVKRIVSVSCDVQTFARDARILIDGGYKIGTVIPIDQFRHTPHVELVAGFTR